MILSDAGTKNNNVNTVLMSVGTTNSQWKTKQFLLKINNTGAGTLKLLPLMKMLHTLTSWRLLNANDEI